MKKNLLFRNFTLYFLEDQDQDQNRIHQYKAKTNHARPRPNTQGQNQKARMNTYFIYKKKFNICTAVLLHSFSFFEQSILKEFSLLKQ